jgi:hypothetical protein
MLFVHRTFSGFIGTKIADTSLGCEVLISLAATSAAQVDERSQDVREKVAAASMRSRPLQGGRCMAVACVTLTGIAGMFSSCGRRDSLNFGQSANGG